MEKAISYNKAIQVYLVVKLVIAGLFFIAACGFSALGFLVYTSDDDLAQDINSLTYGLNIFIGVVAFALVLVVVAYIVSFILSSLIPLLIGNAQTKKFNMTGNPKFLQTSLVIRSIFLSVGVASIFYYSIDMLFFDGAVLLIFTIPIFIADLIFTILGWIGYSEVHKAVIAYNNWIASQQRPHVNLSKENM